MKKMLPFKRLFTCGLFGPLVFILFFLAQGAVRPGYAPLIHPVSALSFGPQGWQQRANFALSGLLIILFAYGLYEALRPSRGALPGAKWGPLLIGLAGLGLMGAGLFNCDPLNGYPPGTPLFPETRTLPGRLHDLFSLPVFTTLPAACFVFARRFAREGRRGWFLYSLFSGLAMLGFFILAGLGFRQVPGFFEVAGLLQRLSIAAGLGWVSALAAFMLRRLVTASPVPAD